MEWIANLQEKIICLDTAPIIYFIEQNPAYIEIMREFFIAFNRGDFKIVTSTITLVEILVHPWRQGNTTLAQEYRDILLNQNNFTIVELTVDIAEIAAQLRGNYNLRTPDAIQIATGIHEGATFFLTNDRRLPSLNELQILVLENLKN